MTATADTRTQLLAAVTADPDDRNLRWAFADRLQEQGEAEDAARAELVRVQCRMDAIRDECWCGACVQLRGGGQHHNGPCGIDKRQDDGVRLRWRERELLAAWPAWLSVRCPRCEGSGKAYGADRPFEGPSICPVCRGPGDLLKRSLRWERDTLDGTETVNEVQPRHVRHVGGYVWRVDVPRLGDVWGPPVVEVPDMNAVYTGEPTTRMAPDPRFDTPTGPTPWLAALCVAVPTLASVVPLDAGNFYFPVGGEGPNGRVFFVRPERPNEYHLPRPLYDALVPDDPESNSGWWKRFTSPGAAVDALGRTLVALARAAVPPG